jgi:hypothetical protein
VNKYINGCEIVIGLFSIALLFVTSITGCMVQANTDQEEQQQGLERADSTSRPPILSQTDDRAKAIGSVDGEITSTYDPIIDPMTLDWKERPVIPEINKNAVDIFEIGIIKGNNPNSFSKVGDCESRTTWFLYDFDQRKETYSLGPYQELDEVIDYYHGSFGRLSLVAKPGFTAASVLTPLWADKELCAPNETPLGCEYRIHKPSVSLIMLGTNDISHPDSFEGNMRKIIEYSIDQGVVPILATKADNLEGDDHINMTISKLASEYSLPLWNFWLAVQSLPNKGLQPDGAHLTWSPNQFDDKEAMERAWPVRNLTALQVLDAFREKSILVE